MSKNKKASIRKLAKKYAHCLRWQPVDHDFYQMVPVVDFPKHFSRAKRKALLKELTKGLPIIFRIFRRTSEEAYSNICKGLEEDANDLNSLIFDISDNREKLEED